MPQVLFTLLIVLIELSLLYLMRSLRYTNLEKMAYWQYFARMEDYL